MRKSRQPLRGAFGVNRLKGMCIVVAMVSALAATCLFSACSKEEHHTEPVSYDQSFAKSRTVMVYMVAENSMYGDVESDGIEMLSGMTASSMFPGDRLVVYVDDMGKPRIYVIDRNTTATMLKDMEPVPPVYEEDVNSASAEQLGAFVKFVKQNYPAESYGLVMWSHGSGWIPSSYSGDQVATASRRSFGVDNGNNSKSGSLDVGHQMNIPEMAHALENALKEQGEADFKLDFILFDACFMQSIEVAYELRGVAKWIISSPAEIPGYGADYTTMVPAMFKKENFVEKMLDAYYQEYYNKPNWGIVLSAVETEGLDSYAGYMKQVVANYREAMLSADYSSVQNYLWYGTGTWKTDIPDGFDMQGVMKKVLDAEDFALWRQEVAKVVTCRHAGFWYSARGGRKTYPIKDEECCGVTMFVPLSKYETNPYKFNESYLGMAWAQDVWCAPEEMDH